MKQIIEKSHEYKSELEILFVNFQQAFDFVNRKELMVPLRIPAKLIASADDLALITKRKGVMVNMLEEIVNEGKKIELKINLDNTKIIRLGKELGNRRIKVGIHNYFEEVEKFIYLGILLSSNGDGQSK